MMNWSEINKIYFIGIGGIGMSALARFFKRNGKLVAGYDKTPTTLTCTLSEEGISVHYEDSVELIPRAFLNNSTDILVVYTPAIPKQNKQYNYFKDYGFKIAKRAEVLGLITSGFKTLAISGTHGKTTTSTITAHLLLQSGKKCSAFLGGISKNYKRNFLFSEDIGLERPTYNSEENWVVVEADEYDRSFLQLRPYIAVITAVDADHLEIYGNLENIKIAFKEFVKQIHPDGKLIIKKGVNLTLEARPKDVYTYSITEEADFCAKNIRNSELFYTFDFVTPTFIMENVRLGTPGLINIENAIAAGAIAYLTGVSDEDLKSALQSFEGVQRRFDFQLQTDSMLFIDDYAHHPEELKAFIKSVRDMLPGKKITGIFQPHLYSRTRDFADDFARSLEYLDELILLEIYPAREEAIPGINAQMLLDKVDLDEKCIVEKANILEFLQKKEFEVLLTMGAGDIDTLVGPIKQGLSVAQQNKK